MHTNCAQPQKQTIETLVVVRSDLANTLLSCWVICISPWSCRATILDHHLATLLERERGLIRSDCLGRNIRSCAKGRNQRRHPWCSAVPPRLTHIATHCSQAIKYLCHLRCRKQFHHVPKRYCVHLFRNLSRLSCLLRVHISHTCRIELVPTLHKHQSG
jgi:hypothetical protein